MTMSAVMLPISRLHDVFQGGYSGELGERPIDEAFVLHAGAVYHLRHMQHLLSIDRSLGRDATYSEWKVKEALTDLWAAQVRVMEMAYQ
jgi:hypothetical protein